MRRLLLPVIAGLIVAAVAYAAGTMRSENTPRADDVAGKAPWTSQNFNNDGDTFRYAIVSDRTGGHRAGIFSRAINYLNLMQPEFVLSVGDLIEGYSDKVPAIEGMWKEFDSYISKLTVPFFHVPGNHDTANTTMTNYWKQKFGKLYYHFVYKNVLFLCAHTEDFPENTKQAVRISPEQIAYFDKVLKDNPNVRWTIVNLHRPIWNNANADEVGFIQFEQLLQGRKYTMFAGHEHHYQKVVRHGMNYYQLATTGGGSKLRGVTYGEFDHITWITMKKDGPVIANVLLSGILPEDLSEVQQVAEEKGVTPKDRRELVAAAGKLTMNGLPVENAEVVFYYLVPEDEQPKVKGAKQIRASDGLTNAQGEFRMSTYTMGDGVPKGDFIVVVVPFKSRTGLSVQNAPMIPEKYKKWQTSPLKLTVKEGNVGMRLEIVD
jgi:hypothetical protein